MYILGSLAVAMMAAHSARAATAFGWATGTTGGAGAAPATPSSKAQLKSWLEDGTPRNIVIDRTWDFTDDDGTVTEQGCKPWSCTPNVQLAMNGPNWCDSTPTKVTVTYKKAPTIPIQIGSNKSIIGKGTSGWIKGKGFRIVGATNIIIQNIRFSDMNPQYVWGGDAITIHGGSKIWIDYNYFKDVGRQFIVTGFGPSTQVTISDNYFDGRATWTPFCDGHHYWALLFTGAGDTITFARNYVYSTSGRSPKLGGSDTNTQSVHIYNNYFHNVVGHALDAGVGSRVLFEGNYFNSVPTPSTGDPKGVVFAPTSSSASAQCSSVIGRVCKANGFSGSGSFANGGNTGALSSLTGSFVRSNPVMDASQVSAYVLANAGLGKI